MVAIEQPQHGDEKPEEHGNIWMDTYDDIWIIYDFTTYLNMTEYFGN
jgi:hypothetical protein